jgi:hypothetical protein
MPAGMSNIEQGIKNDEGFRRERIFFSCYFIVGRQMLNVQFSIFK